MAQIENLDFDLDNFDLETIDIGGNSNHNEMGNLNISNMLPKSQNNIKSISMNSTGQNINNEISNSNEFGLDMLVNKNKTRKDSGSNSPNLNTNSPPRPTPVGPENKNDPTGLPGAPKPERDNLIAVVSVSTPSS